MTNITIGDPGWGNEEKQQYRPRKPGCWSDDPRDVQNYSPEGEEWAAGMDFTLYNMKKQQMKLEAELKYDEPYYGPNGTPVGYFNRIALARAEKQNAAIKQKTLDRLNELGLDIYGLRLLLNDDKTSGVFMSK